MMTAMMMLIFGLQCLRRPWGAHKGQHDVSSPRMRGEEHRYDFHHDGDRGTKVMVILINI